ncbi:helix-turn-helix transcriptional regulator [Levilactobacillus brevis]
MVVCFTVLNLRVEKGLTQSDVARISGLSTSMISKIESQYTVPSVKKFLTIYFSFESPLTVCLSICALSAV